MFNQYGNGYGMPYGTGAQYTSGNPLVYKQWLSNDELQSMIQKGGDQLSLQITEDERRRAICNHRTVDGTNDVIVPVGDDGTCKCLFCGYTFRPVSEAITKEDVQDAVDQVVDILQTVKLFYINMPPEAAREYFQIIPLLEKLPKLMEYAIKDFANHAEYDPMHYNNRGMNSFSAFEAILGGGVPPYYGQPNPYQPQGYQQFNPQQPNQFGQPAAPGMNVAAPQAGSNGFGYYGQQPMMQQGGYQPQTAGYQFNPQQAPFQQQPAQAQPVAPQQVPTVPQAGVASPQQATATTTPDGKTVDVKAQFKS